MNDIQLIITKHHSDHQITNETNKEKYNLRKSKQLHHWECYFWDSEYHFYLNTYQSQGKYMLEQGNTNTNASYHKMPQDCYFFMSQPLNPASH